MAWKWWRRVGVVPGPGPPWQVQDKVTAWEKEVGAKEGGRKKRQKGGGIWQWSHLLCALGTPNAKASPKPKFS